MLRMTSIVFLVGTVGFAAAAYSATSSTRSWRNNNKKVASERRSFQVQLVATHQKEKDDRSTRTTLLMQSKLPYQETEDHENHRCLHPCPEPDDDNIDLDRREAAFAALGALWAVSGGVGASLLFPSGARAVYGSDAKLELPNPYQQLADRATKQCLVESLGNRECMVYADDVSNFLYQGADAQALLGRIEKASAALATIPVLNESRKWSQITGVMTGPCGELIRTMGQVADLSENADAARQIVASTKKNLYAIQDGVNRKDQELVMKYHTATTNDLVAFVKAL